MIVEIDSQAHASPTSVMAEGGIVGCSEWMWLEEELAQQIVEEHNAALEEG